MRKLYFLIVILVITGISLHAQIKLTEKTHGIIPGDAHRFIFVGTTDEGPAGKNVTWDFSNSKQQDKTLTSHMYKSSDTQKGNEIDGASVAIEEFGAYFYFKESAYGIEHYGYTMGNTVIKYDEPLLKLKFPFTYGDHTSGNYSGTQTSGTSVTKFSGTYDITADGYGKLILPDGNTISNTLRIKQMRTYTCNSGCSLTEIIYRWYVADVHYPIFVIIKYEDASGKTTSTLTAYHPYTELQQNVASSEPKTAVEKTKVDAYPNPWSDKVTLEYTLNTDCDVEIALYDQAGKKVKDLLPKQLQTQGKKYITIEGDETVKQGIYFVKIKYGNQVDVKKLVKAF